MTYYKGFDVLIDAATQLPDDCAVLIGGDGEMLDHYKTMVAKRGLTGKCSYSGHIGDDDAAKPLRGVRRLLHAFDRSCQAYGVAMVEAMAKGKPIVATDIGGRAYLGSTSMARPVSTCRLGQAGPLARALTRFARRRAAARHAGAAARQRYLRDFNSELMTRRRSTCTSG